MDKIGVEFGQDGAMKWQRVSPPIFWRRANAYIVADRHLPDGTRQHMVQGSVDPNRIVSGAHVIGEDDARDAEFSEIPSHLSSFLTRIRQPAQRD